MNNYDFTFDDADNNSMQDDNSLDWYEKSIKEEKIIDGKVYERYSCDDNKNYYRYDFVLIPEGYILGDKYISKEEFDSLIGKIQVNPKNIFRLTKPVMVSEKTEYNEDEVLVSKDFRCPIGHAIKYEYEIKVKGGWQKADDLYEFEYSPQYFSNPSEFESLECQLEGVGGEIYLEEMIKQEIISLYELDLFFK